MICILGFVYSPTISRPTIHGAKNPSLSKIGKEEKCTEFSRHLYILMSITDVVNYNCSMLTWWYLCTHTIFCYSKSITVKQDLIYWYTIMLLLFSSYVQNRLIFDVT